MHNGRANGDGTTESGVGVEPGAACAQLESMASSRSLPAGLVARVRIVLLSAAGKMNQQIARQLGLSNATVGKWRRRFVEQGVAGLHDELRPGGPRPISDERVAQLVRKNTGDETERRHPLECAANRRPDPAFEIHLAPHLAGLRAGAAPAFHSVRISPAR